MLWLDQSARSWQGPGILLDFGDFNSPVDKWFPGRSAYEGPVSARVLVDWPRFQEECEKEWSRKQMEQTEKDRLAEKEDSALEDTAGYVELGYGKRREYRGYFNRKCFAAYTVRR